jgi:signal transduction histidine kinase/DNA-binding response OmpR family regulator
MSEDKANILVVDDAPDRLLTMRAVLEELDQNVVTAQSGREALRYLLDRDFAVILLDVNMPDMDGFETAALIRKRKRTEHTPILFVTAFSDEAHALQGYSLGAVDYILSPVAPEVLRTKVGVFVELYRNTQQIRRHAEQQVTLAREQAARAAAEETMRRSSFLAEASNVLAGSLDYEATLDAFAQLVVPKLADQLVISMCPERFEAGRLEVAEKSADGSVARQVIELEELPAGLASAIEHMTSATCDVPQPAVRPLAPLPLRTDNLTDSMLLPLYARGKLLGVAALCWRPARPAMSGGELALVQELVSRAAIAVDNARLYSEIQTNDRRKDEFLAMLGHELRNPLGAIAHAVECITMFADDPAASATSHDVLHRQVQKMSHMVDDLLDVSRITRGKIELETKPVDLAVVISGALATAEAKIAARSHRLFTSVPADPLPLLADPTRLEQIVGNLLDNAAKYTEPGGEIRLVAERKGPLAVLTISDSGIGIAPSLLPQVFDLFAQGDCSLDRSQGGLGIGLTLVKRLVELHGGTVEAYSEGPQRGSTFAIRLPLAQKSNGEATPRADRNGSATAVAPRRVLVVDDNADLSTMTAALLRRIGHEVQVADDGPAALEAAAATQFDVGLIDIGLPGMNGYELAERLQQQASNGERPLLVAMTGYGQEEDRRRSRAAGFDHHLVKPIEFQQLQQIIADAPILHRSATLGRVLS